VLLADKHNTKSYKMAICPICKSTAEEIEPGFFDGKTFRCEKDGEFGVADSVLEMPAYMNAASAGWEVALRRVRTKLFQERARESAPTTLIPRHSQTEEKDPGV
jgi:hypothetical protein